MKKKINKLTYSKSGVNIEKANKLINNLKKGSRPNNPNIIAGIGGFSSLYALNSKKYREPVIVSGTDGVGTKLKIAKLLNEHRYIGQDLLAMCVNDVITSGASPLFFLDYLATSKLDLKLHTTVLNGIKKACAKINIPLLGGETAEMPGMYKDKDYDLAGFCVGVVDKKNIINSKKVKSGDIIIGLNSSGVHSNGFSLINKLIQNKSLLLRKNYDSTNLSKALIKPTKIYVDAFHILKNKVIIHGAAHITGGGLTENLPRVIPKGLSANIKLDSWKIPKVFHIIQEKASLKTSEILKIFNCGIGMIFIISPNDANKTIRLLKSIKYTPKIIGNISKSRVKNRVIYE